MIKEGDVLPDIALRSVADDGMQNVNLHENFHQKKILIICVPGAFTSTCHNQHLPPFIKGAEQLMSEKNIDKICCITTNDPFVLDKWQQSLGESKIVFLSDGNFDFSSSKIFDIIKAKNLNKFEKMVPKKLLNGDFVFIQRKILGFLLFFKSLNASVPIIKILKRYNSSMKN